MATVTGKTSIKIDDLLDDTLVSGELDEEGALSFTTKGGTIINAGSLGASVVSAVINGAKHLIFTTMQGNDIDAGSIETNLPINAWPVGSIFLAVVPTNPNTLLGGGTWVAWAKGRMPVGVDSADPLYDAVEETGGSKEKTLSTANLPPHVHTINHSHTMQSRPQAGSILSLVAQGGGAATIEADTAVNNFNGNSGNGPGTSEPVDVLNPYITCYMWKRTA